MMVYSMTEGDITSSANTAKELIIQALAREGMLKEGLDPETIAASYFVVTYRKGLLGRIFDKLTGTSENELHLKVVKSV